MYLGRFFIIGGFLLLLGQPWILLPYAVGYWLYMDSRVGREEARLRKIFGESYERYCAQVRRFVPGMPKPGERAAVLGDLTTCHMFLGELDRAVFQTWYRPGECCDRD